MCAGLWGVSSPVRRLGQQLEKFVLAEVVLGWPAVDGESPVRENMNSVVELSPSSSGPVKSAVNLPGPPGKPEYSLVTDSGLVP